MVCRYALKYNLKIDIYNFYVSQNKIDKNTLMTLCYNLLLF